MLEKEWYRSNEADQSRNLPKFFQPNYVKIAIFQTAILGF